MKENEAGSLLPMTVTEGVTVTILPNDRHEFLMTTKEVAIGYGVSTYAIRQTLSRHALELLPDRHYLGSVTIRHGASPGSSKGTLWTKRGIVRLGFFIRSERARLFRDWAEDLVVALSEQPAPAKLAARASGSRRDNRLTPERVIDLLSDICLIENKTLRERLAAKIKGGYEYGNALQEGGAL